MNSCKVVIEGEELILLPQRAFYWPTHRILGLSDLHLGKAGHFRKHGIPVSRQVHRTDLRILEQLIHDHRPEKVMLLGDLFHSDENAEWEDFLQFLQVFEETTFILVEGNHDILDNYPAALQVMDRLSLGPFLFTHISEESDLYNIAGHIHPGVMVRGKGRQGMVMPCFLFRERNAIIPAFGQFTGIKKVKPHKKDRVFAIVGHNIIELN